MRSKERLTLKKFWMLYSLIFFFLLLSLDEIAMIHEYLGELSDNLLAGGSRRH
ncbi:MAG: hypothetical protein H8E14_00355 [Candidatus Marinimicrobia bacterium]|nr:hypothetical protein [Candidatus Neomarinimicrobiota bacterium]